MKQRLRITDLLNGENMLPDPTVAIAREAHPYQCTRMCLEMLRLDGFRGLSSVFVKFNLAPYFQFRWAGVCPSHRAGVGTHPEVVRAVIHHLRDLGVPRIIVGEGPAGDDSPETTSWPSMRWAQRLWASIRLA